MAEPKLPDGKAAGPWDVVMHFVKSFPIVAVAAALVWGVVYVVGELARVQADSSRQVYEAQKKVMEANEASSKIMQERLEKSNTLLLEVATKIQNLVSGQVTNMEQMERMRASLEEKANLVQKNTEEIQKAKLADYAKQRALLETQVAELKADNELQIARGIIEKIRGNLKTGDAFRAFDIARNFFGESFKPTKEQEFQELEKQAQATQPGEWKLKLILLNILSRVTDQDRYELAVEDLFKEHLPELDRDTTRFILDGYTLSDRKYRDRLPLSILVLGNTAGRELRTQLTAFDYLASPPSRGRSLLFNSLKKEDFFQVLLLANSILFNPGNGANDYDKITVLRAVPYLEPAAYQVWSALLVERNPPLAAQISDLSTSLKTDFPMLQDPVTEELRRIWTEPDLTTLRSEYPKVGTLSGSNAQK